MAKSILMVVFLLGLAPLSQASGFTVGSGIPAMKLEDQHGVASVLPGNAKRLIFTADKSASDLVNGYLAAQAPDYLVRQEAVFVADISGMPSLITRFVALPAMRELPYSLHLVRDAQAAAFLPRRKGQATLVDVRDGKVSGIGYAAGSDDFASFFE